MRQVTLLFLRKNDSILLAMKKRGFGAGHWNGVGGKLEPNETVEAAAIRECEEEINVIPERLSHVANLYFHFAEKPDWNQHAVVFTATSWSGEPTETEEMAPKWFNINQIPYEKMWEDDIFWLPLVLRGNLVEGTFEFDENNKLVKHAIYTKKSLVL